MSQPNNKSFDITQISQPIQKNSPSLNFQQYNGKQHSNSSPNNKIQSISNTYNNNSNKNNQIKHENDLLQPLNNQNLSEIHQNQDEEHEQEKEKENNPFLNDKNQHILSIMSRIVYISLPNIASFLSLWILNLANCHFTEKYQKEDELSAYAISYMWVNALGFALILCLNTGLCAMSSQAIGLRQYNLVSKFYQRSQVLNFTLISICIIIMLFTKQIFSSFTKSNIAQYAQQFIYGYFPSLLAYIIFDSTRNIFNAYKKFKIPNLLLLVTYTLHALWVYLFLAQLKWGLFGLGLSRTITETLNASILIFIVKKRKMFKHLSFKWSKQAFKKWGQYLKLSIPMGSVLYLDWVASDIQTFFVAAYKNSGQLAGHSAFVSIFLLFVIIPHGISITIMSFVGQAIGRGDIQQCKRITKVTLFLSLCTTVTIAVISYVLEDYAADIFTNTKPERENFLICYKIYTMIILQGNGITDMIGAILRTAGLQNIAFVVPLISYFVIGIPLQYVFVFVFQWGLKGSWYSYSISVIITSICYLIRVFNIDWQKQIETVKKNVQNQIDEVIESNQTPKSSQDLLF